MNYLKNIEMTVCFNKYVAVEILFIPVGLLQMLIKSIIYSLNVSH